MRRTLAAIAAVAAAALFAGAPRDADAAVRRYALLIGADQGDAGDVELRFAESDATRVARILRDMGDFRPEDALVLSDVTADDVRRALIELNTRIRSSSDESMLFVFYSGHADAESLHLRGTRLELDELRNLVTGSPASARVLVIDACRSGAITRVKGGHPGPSFAIDLDQALTAEGVAILTSSAAGEDSQESDQLGASFFTHFLASGMLGAADANGDGIVSLGEAFTFASEQTLIATAGTVAGPQHPTYRFDLGGHGDLVLTSPGKQGKRFGTLAFGESGTWLVQKGGASGNVVAEVATSGAAREIALLPGGYFVTLRAPGALRQGRFSVDAGATTRVSTDAMEAVAYAQLVRKGGLQAQPRALSAFTSGGVQGSMQRLGAMDLVTVGSRLDTKQLSIELRVTTGRGRGSLKPTATSPFLPLTSRELLGSVAAFHAFDVDGLGTISVGGEAGAGRIERRLDHGPSLTKPMFFYATALEGGATVSAEARVYRRLYFRLGGEAEVFALPPPPSPNDAAAVLHGVIEPHVTGSVQAGLGVYF